MKNLACSRICLLTSGFLFLVIATIVYTHDVKAASPSEAALNTQQVYLVFDGPWAFAPDPDDPAKIIALAPKAVHHHDLFVQSHSKVIPTGVYDLSFPPFSKSNVRPTIDPDILQASIGAQNVQHVLETRFARYAIRLPRPEAYIGELYSPSRVGTTYPPDGSTQREHVSSLALRYTVSTLKGFSLDGTPDTGTFTPLVLRLGAPTIQFEIDAEQDSSVAGTCHIHEREAFHSLTKLINVTLFLDFQDDESTCRERDPQNPGLTASKVGLERGIENSSVAYVPRMLPVLYFFGGRSNCRLPTILDTAATVGGIPENH